MVSRRNYFAMILTMLILFFLFQFTAVAKKTLNEYGINEYAEAADAVTLNEDSMYRTDGKQGASFSEMSSGRRPYILFVGNEDSEDIRHVVTWWCTYSKRDFRECSNIVEYEILEEDLPQAIVIDGQCLNLWSSRPVLKSLTERGVHLIFARMPKTNELARDHLFMNLVGISEVRQHSVELKGVRLFGGFLLGGERIYEAKPGEEEKQDMDLNIPWYVAGGGTKTYMMGILGKDENGEEYENEILPTIVWRKNAENAKIFCVNGDFLSHMYGIGFLSAMLADTGECEVYPIVNSQNLSVVNFSGFADENGEELTLLYNQPQTALCRELIWPALASVMEENHSKATLLTTPQYDYEDENDPDAEELIYYLRLLKEAHGEMGYSLDSDFNVAPEDKLVRDEEFFRKGAEEYAIRSLYLKEKKSLRDIDRSDWPDGIRTVVMAPEGEEPVLNYIDGNRTQQNITSTAGWHTYTDDLALMAIETALGYSNVAQDMRQVTYPQSGKDHWENLSRAIAENTSTYWKDYDCFTETTLTESDGRVRRFLALDFRTRQQGNQFFIKRNQVEGQAWFLVKPGSTVIADMTGGTYTQLSGGFYLIEMEEREAVLTLKEKKIDIYE